MRLVAVVALVATTGAHAAQRCTYVHCKIDYRNCRKKNSVVDMLRLFRTPQDLDADCGESATSETALRVHHHRSEAAVHHHCFRDADHVSGCSCVCDSPWQYQPPPLAYHPFYSQPGPGAFKNAVVASLHRHQPL